MEETRKRLEEFFDEMLRNMKYFKKKSYEQIFKDTYENQLGCRACVKEKREMGRLRNWLR